MATISFKKLIVMCLTITSSVYAIDYCNGNDQETGCDVCCESRTHIQCGQTEGEFDSQCSSNSTLIEMTQDIKDMILEFHHQKRNEVALGNVPPYEPAKRMATIVWDDDLAKNAEFHVQRCIFAHDECRTTEIFRSPGQSIALDLYELAWKSYDKSPVKHVEHLMSGWWDREYMNANMEIIKDYVLPDDEFDPKQFGHFTQLIWNNAYTIGCAASKFLYDYNGFKNAVMLTCNYALGNGPHEMVYEPGPAASGCKSGTNPEYPGLCSVDEKWKHFYFNN